MESSNLKIIIYPLQAWGHINACLGVAEVLRERGHHVVFVMDSTLKNHFKQFSYEEYLLFRKDVNFSLDDSFIETAERYRKQFGLKVAEYHRLYGDEALKGEIDNFNLTIEYDPQVDEAIKKLKPDLFITDGYFNPGSVLKNKIPLLMNWSSNPLMIDNIYDYLNNQINYPPYGSGLSTNVTDKHLWKDDLEYIHENIFKGFIDRQILIYQKAGVSEELIAEYDDAPYIYGFPQELDYAPNPLTDNCFRIDSYCRKIESKEINLPENFFNPEKDTLIYLSLGTISSVDIELMKRICGIIAKLPYKFIICKGLHGDEYSLPNNCWGDKMVPQIDAIKKSSLVITHGGNNTVTETLTYGKPMIVLPMFFDQFDNAQRVQEQGYGIRLDPYRFEFEDISSAIHFLLNDPETQQKCSKISERIFNSNRKAELCDWIENYCKNKNKKF